ncbi:efflux RND transporter periplasmic adaptor subunit [Agromyces archimandritae]|uniref:Efflux RND transporter periplasmic adaptor subunit n=1 Tax=Agromyces archimandritae TaxID=2781962 RepID=A0A975IP92_9MICO|nr:efflux RND transporter periplasmic adaptor subunit [Agromyces archimandritae]QTX05029.1 efflux RND transporter periplasmic adaptor subunit [Agromyces archimandritae]
MWRKWIFPTLKTVLAVVIAVALVKLAFFPDQPAVEASITPGGTVSEPEFVVAEGSIVNDVVLTGTVNADAAVAVKAAGTGVVDEVFIAQGSQVAAGDKIYDIKVEDPVEEAVVAPVQPGPDGQLPAVQAPAGPSYHFEPVLAPAAGVLTALDVIPGQPVSTGEVSGQVAPPSFNVSASLSPEQQYRLTDRPGEANVVIAGGPAPFTCTDLAISTPLAGQGGGAGSADGAAEAGGGTTVSCRVPAEVQVFAGLSAQVTIAAGRAEGVLVVPTTAVEGGAESGVVWLVDAAGGEPVEQPVKLGITDGAQVEVVEGLAAGDAVLQFVPGASAVPPGMEGCQEMGGGAVMCMSAK